MDRGNRSEPTRWAVAEWWAGREDRFPENRCHWVGLGEPYCFACRRSVPLDQAALEPLEPRHRWNRSGLHRAHLVDRSAGGLDDVQNIVLLCRRCHGIMPAFGVEDGEKAMLWVRQRVSFDDEVAMLVKHYTAMGMSDDQVVEAVTAAAFA